MALSARVISVLKPYFQQFFLSFKVEDWPLAAAGKFFSEEVYIVLNCISQEKTSMMVRNKKQPPLHVQPVANLLTLNSFRMLYVFVSILRLSFGPICLKF